MQGPISEWTADIVQEYKNNFPTAQIVISTWINEKTDNIPCEIVKTELPPKTSPYMTSANYQIVGAQIGLQKMNSAIIMKCRTDQFIHNRNVFKLFLESCTKNKIMLSAPLVRFDKRDYYLGDSYQVAFKEILQEYWNSMPLSDGSENIIPEIYFTRNYVKNIKKYNGSWPNAREKYFCIKDAYLDFKLEFEKDMKFEQYSKYYQKPI